MPNVRPEKAIATVLLALGVPMVVAGFVASEGLIAFVGTILAAGGLLIEIRPHWKLTH